MTFVAPVLVIWGRRFLLLAGLLLLWTGSKGIAYLPKYEKSLKGEEISKVYAAEPAIQHRTHTGGGMGHYSS